MPVNKFGKHHLSHDDDIPVLVDDLPKMYYETQILVIGARMSDHYQMFNGRPTYHVQFGGVITRVNCSSLLKVIINHNEVKHNDLVGRTLNKGDVISFKPDGNKTPLYGGAEFTLRVPIITE